MMLHVLPPPHSHTQHPIEHDVMVVEDSSASPRARVAARLTKIEKSILMDSLKALEAAAGGPVDAAKAEQMLKASPVKFT